MRLKFMTVALLSVVLSVSALAADWIVDKTAKTITDGDWTFAITPARSGTTFTLGKSTEKGGVPGSGTVLDFRNNAIKDADGTDWQMTAASGSFGSLTAVTSILIPDTVTDIGTYAFYSSPELAYVRLSDNITAIGSSSFRDVPKLTTVEPLLPSKVASISLSSAFGAPIVADEIVFGDGTHDITWSGSSGGFGSASIKNIIFTEGITVVQNRLFRQTKGTLSITFPSTLKEIQTYVFSDVGTKTLPKVITFNSAPPTFGANAFESIGALTTKVVVPYDSWQSVLADSSKFIPYDEATHGASWQAMFPGEPAPDGILKAGWTGVTKVFNENQWVVAIRTVSEHSKLYVVGNPDAYGEVNPGYGTIEFDTAAVSCPISAPEYYVDGDDLYTCRGYDYQTQNDDDSWTDPIRIAKRSDTFEVSKRTTARVTWIWEKVGARLGVGYNGELGTVTALPAPVFEDCYLFGAEVALAAAPKDGATFGGWYEPSFEDGKTMEQTITLTMTEPRSAFAYFPSGWQHVGKTLVGNGWSIPVDKEGPGELTVKKPTATLPGAAVIDLRNLPIDDGSTIVAVDGLVSDGAPTATLVELYLPETVSSLGAYFCYAQPSLRKVVRPQSPTSVGRCYCRECPNLETVEPADLSTVAALEKELYYSSCPKLKGEVTLGDGIHDPFLAAIAGGGTAFCYDSGLTKVTVAEGVGALPKTAIRSCPQLAEVVLPSTLTNVVEYSLCSLSGLRKLVMPNIPKMIGTSSLTLDAPEKQVRVYIPHDHPGGWSELIADPDRFRRLTSEERVAFREAYPGEKMPLGIVRRGAWRSAPGIVYAPGADQYLVNLPSGEGFMILVR